MKPVKLKLLRRTEVKDQATDTLVWRSAGHEWFVANVEDARTLVKLGVAVAADKRSANVVGVELSAEQLLGREKFLAAADAGIAVEDMQLFMAEKITGYNPDFDPDTMLPSDEFVKGPTWTDEDTARCNGECDDEECETTES